MSAYAAFDYQVQDGVGTVTFARPDTLNSLTFEVYAELERLAAACQTDGGVRVLVLTGTGKGFCSGGDVHEIIGELGKRDVKGMLEFTRMTGAVVRNLRLLDKPVIAAINGIAAGAGAVLALAADFRIMAEAARFAFLFTKVGLAGADMGAAFLLPRIVGFGRATELLMLGDTIDAATAERYGLTSRVVPVERLGEETRALARRLAEGPAQALAMTKRMLSNEWGMDLVSAIEAEAQAQALLLMAEDHKEFYRAFTEKRPPRFTGR
ncbi:MAG TPA: enoyl-CoA hydratase family protein [Methylomirabilota bacterium]|jgi:enoyl-CoA hydratase/carnithine racemase|nr:enoyl-CoA hydratase family protein [Methylomirabilota bacterium]